MKTLLRNGPALAFLIFSAFALYLDKPTFAGWALFFALLTAVS